MIRSLKEIRKELKNRRVGQERERDDEGRVIVDFCVHSDDDFLSPYSLRSNAELSTDVADFIERSLDTVPVKEQVRLRVHSNVITEEEQKSYETAIHGYYEDRFESLRREKRRLLVIAALMALIGIFALTVMIGLEVTGRRTEVLSEIIDIFAWVFLWETVDLLCFEYTSLRIKSWRYLALSACVIEYLPLTKGGDTV
ncbi:MAG: hypothetical protein E7355_04320 [Clostridiales bacterium]|nr:hypothetical protein [Clostridiales bacterium]